jgi:predicted ATPase
MEVKEKIDEDNEINDPHHSATPLLWFEERHADARVYHGTLHGRAEEVKWIYQIYEAAVQNASNKCAAQLVLMTGVTGIGKTALARSLRHPVEDVGGGYFVCGKFDQFPRPEPHAAIVEAFAQLVSRVKASQQVSALRDALLKQGIDYDHGGRDLIAVIPALKDVVVCSTYQEKSMGDEEDASVPLSLISDPITPGPSTNRWKDLFRLFLRAFSYLGKRLVLLIEDLHWMDECSLDVLHALVEDQRCSAILFVCTYRTNSESNFMGLDRLVQELEQNVVRITRIHLEGLNRTALSNLVSSVLSVSDDRAAPLAWTIYDWTKGNAFLVWNCLYSLRSRNLISFDETCCQFKWDLEEIQMEMESFKNVIRSKIERLPLNMQEYLRAAACLGSLLDEEILRRLLAAEQNLITTFMNDAAETRLIRFDKSRGAWCFCHDSVQEAMYQLIPVNERSAYHYRIGRKLWKVFNMDELSQFLFLVVSQLLLGIECASSKRERRAIAKLCLEAGVRAFKSSSFQASYRYLEQGIHLLDVEGWNDDYELAMDLYNGAAEVANELGRFQDVHRLVDLVLVHSKFGEHSLRAKTTKVHALGRSSKLAEAIALALDVLSSLGEPLPTNPSQLRIFSEVTIIRRRLRGKTNEMLLRLPSMTDTKKLAAMEMMNLMFFYVVFVKPDLAPILGSRMVRMSLDHGLSAVSCIGFVVFAASLAGYVVLCFYFA